MKKIFAFAIAVALILTAVIGGTVAQDTEANIETRVSATGQVDIAFANTGLNDSVKVHPGATVNKNVQIKNKAGSESAWVWFTVTVPAVGDQPLVTVSGTDTGWKLLSTRTADNLCVYTLGYETALAAAETTTPGITVLHFAGQIDRINGTYYWVVNGQTTPILTALDEFSISFDAYAVESTAATTLEDAYAAYSQTNP